MMWRIQGALARDLCDRHLALARRDVLRVGGAGMLGLTLGSALESPLPGQRSDSGTTPGEGG